MGTVILKQCITLAPRHEHLVWGKLKEQVPLSIGSTVVVEPTTSKSAPRNVLVVRTVCLLWGDKWNPMKVVNLLDRPLTLRRNAKVAQVYPCLALEDLELTCGNENDPEVIQCTCAVNTVEEPLVGSGYSGKLS